MRKQGNVVRRRRSVEEWTVLLGEQLNSGLSQRAFCELHGMSLSSFYNAKSRAKALTVEDEFIAVAGAPETIETPAVRSWDIEFALGAGVVLRVRSM